MKHQFGNRALKLFEEQANEVAHYTVTVGSTDHTFLVQSNRPPRDPAAPHAHLLLRAPCLYRTMQKDLAGPATAASRPPRAFLAVTS
jgi:hypothetical protein